jgi:nitrogen regulatory protein PII-like uncharacterized protein
MLLLFNQPTTGTQTLTQTARFNNAQTFYSGTVTQAGGTQTLTQTARFNNAQAFYGGTVTQSGGTQTVTQTVRFNNTQIFYGGTVNGGEQTTGGHYYEFWRKKWAKQWETKTPDIEEVIEFIEEEPEQAIEVAATVSPKYASIQPETLKINEKLAENIAKQIIVAIKLQQIRIAQEEEDIETLLLIA